VGTSRACISPTATPPSQPELKNPAQASNAMPVNGIVRWTARRPGLRPVHQPAAKGGIRPANGLNVQVLCKDTGWKLHASVAVSNGRRSQISCFPRSSHSTKRPKRRNLRRTIQRSGPPTKPIQAYDKANPCRSRPRNRSPPRALPRMFKLWPTASRP